MGDDGYDFRDKLSKELKNRMEDDGGNECQPTQRNQYVMYLSEALQDELDQTFKEANAHRVLENEPELEKHRDFLEAVVRTGLDENWKRNL